jgi:hypothetical protein
LVVDTSELDLELDVVEVDIADVISEDELVVELVVDVPGVSGIPPRNLW